MTATAAAVMLHMCMCMSVSLVCVSECLMCVCEFDLVAMRLVEARLKLKFHCTLLQRLLSTSGPQRQEARAVKLWAWHSQSLSPNAV